MPSRIRWLFFFVLGAVLVALTGCRDDGAEGSVKASRGEEIPTREEVSSEDKWDLSSLFDSDEEWEKGLVTFEERLAQIKNFKGTLGQSPEALKTFLDFRMKMIELDERVGYYAFLKKAGDAGNSDNVDMNDRYSLASTKVSAAFSYYVPEILAIDDVRMKRFRASPVLKRYSRYLQEILRFKPHTLTASEEKLLSKQASFASTASDTFKALNNVDLSFGTIETPEGVKPLTPSTYALFMRSKDRAIRKKAYTQFYEGYEKHKHTLASLYAGSVKRDMYLADVRKYGSALERALFNENVPKVVYNNLIKAVNDALPALHDYYDLRREKLGLDELRHYDVYVSLIDDIQEDKYTYDEAVSLVGDAASPLGEEYVTLVTKGLHGGWVDKYENKGKRSGAFSAGTYAGDPYILLNFQGTLDSLFTLAHEGGHSMHSWYAVHNNPIQDYDYTIFEAEVASIMIEELVSAYLISRAPNNKMRAYYIGKEIDSIIGTVYRQTMFAEFEKVAHDIVEKGEALTLVRARKEYRALLEKYFGKSMVLEEISDLEAFRIPHFYRAFYVYKYATSFAAAVALSKQLLAEGPKRAEDFISFLSLGGSRPPIESLEVAGVDMSKPEPIEQALKRFASLVKELRILLLEKGEEG